MEWISRKDELPPQDEDILAYLPGTEDPARSYRVVPGWRIDSHEASGHYFTHWMRLVPPR